MQPPPLYTRTSLLYGIQWELLVIGFQASSTFREQAMVFDRCFAIKHDVIDAGEKALVIIYNGKTTDSLDSLVINVSVRKWLAIPC